MRMKLFIFVLSSVISLIFNDLTLHAQKKGLEYGLGWGWTGSFRANTHSTFVGLEGYIIDDTDEETFLHSNGFVEAFLGWNFSALLGISLHTGYQGFNEGYRAFTFSLCADVRLTKVDYLFLGVGFGLEDNSSHEKIPTTYIGYARRLSTTERCAVDAKISIQGSTTHPDIYEEGIRIAEENIRKSESKVLGLNFSLELSFY